MVPVVPGMKSPAVAWATYQHRLPTETELRRWWGMNPDFNIGIVTGKISNLAVVDVDPKRGGQVDPFVFEHPTDVVVQTGGNGYHLYYRYPEDIDNVPNLVGFQPGLDIRGDGGIIIAPPSVHTTGSRYAWIRQGGLGQFPAEVVSKREREINEKGWVESLLAFGSESGERNASLAKMAGYLCSLGMGMQAAIGICQLWNTKNRPPMIPNEVDSTVRSVYRTDSRNRERASGEASKARDQKALATGDFNFLELREFMTRNLDQAQPEWMVSGWLPDSTIAFVVSPPGSFKTWLTIDLAVSIATGTKFLGEFDCYRKGPVFLIQQEDFAGQTARRINAVVQSRFGLNLTEDEGGDVINVGIPPEIPIFVHPDRKMKFSDKKAMTAFEAAVQELRPALVIIDPLYSAGSTDDYMAKTAEQMFVLKNIRDKYGCSFLVAHHSKKSEDKDGEITRDRIWGSQFLNAFLETGWQIRLDRSAEISVKRHFKSAPASADIRVMFDIDMDNGLRYNPIVTVKEMEENQDAKSRVDGLYELIEKKGPMLMSKAARELGVSSASVSRKAKDLEIEGLLLRVKLPNSNSIMLHKNTTPDF